MENVDVGTWLEMEKKTAEAGLMYLSRFLHPYLDDVDTGPVSRVIFRGVREEDSVLTIWVQPETYLALQTLYNSRNEM